MRKIISGMFITLDGVIEAPETWNPPYYDDELNQAAMPLLATAGTHLYGRRSYELFRSVFTGPHPARVSGPLLLVHDRQGPGQPGPGARPGLARA